MGLLREVLDPFSGKGEVLLREYLFVDNNLFPFPQFIRSRLKAWDLLVLPPFNDDSPFFFNEPSLFDGGRCPFSAFLSRGVLWWSLVLLLCLNSPTFRLFTITSSSFLAAGGFSLSHFLAD